MRFEIGQQVWLATFSPMTPRYITCPDCGGTGRLRVIFHHDETQVSIDCRNCSVGYDPPSGCVLIYEPQARAQLSIVTGVEVNGTAIRWHLNGTPTCYGIGEDKNIYDNEGEARAAAETLAAAHIESERKRVLGKEKDTRTWAWNASYHRRCIKDAQKQNEYHTSKLAVAAIKAKDKTDAAA